MENAQGYTKEVIIYRDLTVVESFMKARLVIIIVTFVFVLFLF